MGGVFCSPQNPVTVEVRACCPSPGACPPARRSFSEGGSSGTATLKPIQLLGFSCARLMECALCFPLLRLGNTAATRLSPLSVISCRAEAQPRSAGRTCLCGLIPLFLFLLFSFSAFSFFPKNPRLRASVVRNRFFSACQHFSFSAFSPKIPVIRVPLRGIPRAFPFHPAPFSF